MKSKKLLALALSTFTMFGVVSCGETTTTTVDTTEEPTTVEPTTVEATLPEEAKNIYISEVFTTSANAITGAVEISNSGTSSIDLSKYSIVIYKGSGLTSKVYTTFNFSGTLEPNGTYVICNPGSAQDVLDLSNDVIAKFAIYGTNYMEIMYEGVETPVEVYGQKGFTFEDMATGEGSILRKPWTVGVGSPFYKSNFLQTKYSAADTLGNLNFPFESEKQLLEGPHISPEYDTYNFRKPTDETIGEGGLAKNVSVKGYTDGDTTRFGHDLLGSSVSCRYLGVDTPELDHRNMGISPEAWGNGARNFTNAILRKAKGIILQSDIGAFFENNSRALVWVWYTNTENGDLDSYRLLNYEICREGFSEVSGDNAKNLSNNHVSYGAYFKDALNYAKLMGFKLYGEDDPDWDYTNNKPYDYADFA